MVELELPSEMFPFGSEAISPPDWKRLEARALGGSPWPMGLAVALIFQTRARLALPLLQEGHRGPLPSSESWARGLNEERAHVCSRKLNWAYGPSPANSDSRSSVKLLS